VGWSEKLIEPCNSWFSLKQLLGWRRILLAVGGRALEGFDRAKARESYQTPNTDCVIRQLDRGG
jgi:hypothetical protein